MDIRRDKRLSVWQSGIVGGAVVLAVGGDLGKVDRFFYHAAHKAQREIHCFLIAQGFMIVEGGQ